MGVRVLLTCNWKHFIKKLLDCNRNTLKKNQEGLYRSCLKKIKIGAGCNLLGIFPNKMINFLKTVN